MKKLALFVVIVCTMMTLLMVCSKGGDSETTKSDKKSVGDTEW